VSAVRLARRAALLAPTLPVTTGRIAFDSGHASPALLPDLTAEAARALSAHRAEVLQYAPRAGLPAMRAWIAAHTTADGAAIGPDDVLVTNGAKHALELVCRLLLDEGDAVVVTAPTYFSAIPIIRSFGAEFLEVGQDREGLDVEALGALLARRRAAGQPPPRFLYNVPDYHNPTGITMTGARREALVTLARAAGLLLVEDSPYRLVRFEGEPLPTLKALAPDIVLQLGTFSKLLAPGLRVGWVAAPAPLVARMAQLKTDAGSCPLTQRTILEFCEGGRLAGHTASVQATYRAQRDRMAAALRRELPDADFDLPLGGYYLWLTLPDEFDGEVVERLAREAGVSPLAGSRFFARPDADHPRHHLRLAFSHATPAEIEEGVALLGAVCRTAALAR